MKQCHCSCTWETWMLYVHIKAIILHLFHHRNITKDKLFLQSCYICVYPERCQRTQLRITLLFMYVCAVLCLLKGLQQFCLKSKLRCVFFHLGNSKLYFCCSSLLPHLDLIKHFFLLTALREVCHFLSFLETSVKTKKVAWYLSSYLFISPSFDRRAILECAPTFTIRTL